MEIEIPFIPPSENKIRIIRVIRGRPAGMAYTKEASKFKRDFKDYLIKNYVKDVMTISSTHEPTHCYEVTIDLYLDKYKLINKSWPKSKTYIKRMDIGNRRKLLEDCLSECLGIDDSHTFSLSMAKMNTTKPYEYVKIRVTRADVSDYVDRSDTDS